MFVVGNENNVHCLAIAVNSIAGAVFAFYGEKEQRDRMREFLVVCVCVCVRAVASEMGGAGGARAPHFSERGGLTLELF